MTPTIPLPRQLPEAAALAAALARCWGHEPHHAGRLRRGMIYLLAALHTGTEVETYAQVKFGFWYKVFFFTPGGALKSDTGGEVLNRKADARRIIRSQDLHHVPFSAVLENWDMGDLWTERKPLSALLLETWRACRASYYQQQYATRRRSL